MNFKSFLEKITSTFNVSRGTLTTIPPIILEGATAMKPGLSPKMIASNIIKRQIEAGAPIGANIDGSANIAESMEVIRVEEILKALMLDCRVDVVIPINAINVIGTGASPGGPVTVISSNKIPIGAYGIIR